MLERWNYIPWKSRFRRFLDNKLEDRERMWNSIQNGPYARPMISNPDDTEKQIFKPFHVRHSRLMDEFDKFAAKEGESLESVYERLTTLVNIMDRNNVRHIPVSINTKFLNCLQPEWNKFVTMKFSTPTNNHLRTSSNTKNQAVVQFGRVDIQTKNTGYGGNGNRNAGRQNKNQAFNAENGNDDNNQIVQRVPRTESTLRKAYF
ncbi:hypothetical protein Tco_0602034 [Tanacetum coccineum]